MRLSQQHLAANGEEPTLEWLAAQLTFEQKPISAERLATFIREWESTCTGSLESSEEGTEEHSGATRLDQASLRRAELQEQQEASDPQQSLLPELMAVLDEQEQRVIRHAYLRRPPLSAFQLRKAMGGMEQEEVEQLEAQALAKLRVAAQERKDIDVD